MDGWMDVYAHVCIDRCMILSAKGSFTLSLSVSLMYVYIKIYVYISICTFLNIYRFYPGQNMSIFFGTPSFLSTQVDRGRSSFQCWTHPFLLRLKVHEIWSTGQKGFHYTFKPHEGCRVETSWWKAGGMPHGCPQIHLQGPQVCVEHFWSVGHL